jgi:hypothetical protein
MGILISFLIFVYRLKLKVKRLKMALALDKRVEIMLLSGLQEWCMVLKSEIFVTLGRELQTVLLLSNRGHEWKILLILIFNFNYNFYLQLNSF